MTHTYYKDWSSRGKGEERKEKWEHVFFQKAERTRGSMALSLLLRVMCLPFWHFTNYEVKRQRSLSLYPPLTPSPSCPPQGDSLWMRPRASLWWGCLTLDTHTVGISAEVVVFPCLTQVPFLFPWKQLSPKSLTPEIRKIRGPYYHKTILTQWGPLGGRRGGQELHSSPVQLQPLEMLRGTRNLVFISGECEGFCRSEWTFDSGWRWNLSRTQWVLFCFVFFHIKWARPF